MRPFILVTVLIFITGCETFYGVSTSGVDFKTFDYQPCIDKTLRAQSGITYQGIESNTRDKVVSLSGFKANTDRKFVYRINEIPDSREAQIATTDRYDGTTYINHNYGGINRRISQKDKETASRYIDSINLSLRKNCSIVIN